MAENSPTLGEFLRQEREKRGITIEQVASATKISVRLLHSLEADQYADLPAKPFVRGFVNSYARFIGLDSQDLLTRFGDFIDSKAHERPNRESGHSGYAFEKREGEQSRTLLGFVLGGFIIVGAVVGYAVKHSPSHRHGSHIDRLREQEGEPSPGASLGMVGPAAETSPTIGASGNPKAGPSTEPEPSPTHSTSPATRAPRTPSPTPEKTEAEEPESEETPEPSPTPRPSASANPDPLNSGISLKRDEIKQKVIFKALENVVVRYQVDDRPMTKFIFKKEKMLVLRAKQIIRFQTSNPKALEYNYRGGGMKVLTTNPDLTERQGTATLVYPKQLAESTGDPFPKEKPLQKTKDPNPTEKVPSPTPTR